MSVLRVVRGLPSTSIYLDGELVGVVDSQGGDMYRAKALCATGDDHFPWCWSAWCTSEQEAIDCLRGHLLLCPHASDSNHVEDGPVDR